MVFVSAGVRHAVGPFLKPMVADLGVDRASFSLVIALGLLLYGLFMMAAKRTRFSPAGPIWAISTFWSPSSSLMSASTSPVTLPQRCLAGRSSALPSLSQR